MNCINDDEICHLKYNKEFKVKKEMNWEKVIKRLDYRANFHIKLNGEATRQQQVEIATRHGILGGLFLGLSDALKEGLEPNKQSQDHLQHKPSE